MYRTILFISLTLSLLGCSGREPVKGDFLGAYRIIKIEEGEDVVKVPGLNQIELTEDRYIYSVDRDGNNRFTPEEIQQYSYDFGLEGTTPYIRLEEKREEISLYSDDYYDLVFRKEDELETSLYVKSYRLEQKSGPDDFLGEYRVIKIRENGTILNVGHWAKITITEDRYISELDLNRDGVMSGDEKTTFPYTRHINGEGLTYLQVNDGKGEILILHEPTFDLLLMRIDEWGNETVMYLKE